MIKHNKKRNVGLLSEWFARWIAIMLIEHRDLELNQVKHLYSKWFGKDKPLAKELALSKLLFETKLKTRESAIKLLDQVKQASKSIDLKQNDLEKTKLLQEIHALVKDSSKFFNQDVPKFKEHATIQTLLSFWQQPVLTENISDLLQLEERLLEFITTTEQNSSSSGGGGSNKTSALSMTSEEVDGLVVNLLRDKVNKKFARVLSEEQRFLVQEYAFSSHQSGNNFSSVVSLLEKIKEKALSDINKVLNFDSEVKSIEPKLIEVREMILSEEFGKVSVPTDNIVSFYLSVSELIKEINSDDEK